MDLYPDHTCNKYFNFCLWVPEKITPGACTIRLVPGQHEFLLKGGRFACIGETAVCNDISGRGSLQAFRFQNRIDILFFGAMASFLFLRSLAAGIFELCWAIKTTKSDFISWVCVGHKSNFLFKYYFKICVTIYFNYIINLLCLRRCLRRFIPLYILRFKNFWYWTILAKALTARSGVGKNTPLNWCFLCG